MFESRVLRRIFGSGRDEVTGEWRKIHTEELNNLYNSPKNIGIIKSRRNRSARHVACTGKRRGVYRVLVGNSEGKRHFGRHKHRCDDNIKMILRKWNSVWNGLS